MPNWKKVVTSGSNAELDSLKLSGLINAGVDTDKFLVLDSAGNIDFRTGTETLSDINPGGLISSSAQIATEISGAFTAPSGGFSTRLTTLEGAGGTTFSSSVSTRLTSVEGYTLDNVTDNGSSTTNGITVGGLTVNGDISITGTASIGYLESVSGSAKIIGDSYIILNNDTPTQRFAGIVVQDSVPTNTTSSLEFDGLTNDWFYEYSDNGGVTAEHGVVLFGPEYNTKGSPVYPSANVIQKGTGDHHLTGSKITDDGSTVTIGAALNITTVNAAGVDTDKFLVLDSSNNVDYRTGAQVLSDINPGGLISSSAQLTSTFDTRYLNTTGDGVISSSAQVTISSTTGYTTFSSSIASDISGLQGAGYIDGNGGNEFFARFTDSNTLTGSNHLQRDIYGNISINSRTGPWNLATFAPLAPLTVKRGTDDGAVTHNLAYLQVPNGRASSLQFANGNYSTFIGQETDGDFYIGFGNNTDRTFVFQNNGAGGVPTLTLGTLTISGSGTLKNIGPAQFSGSVSITTADQVAASVDTDKFLVLDGQQIKYRTGAQVLTDIGGLALGAIKNYVNVNNVIDFKATTDGYAPVTGITDIQTSPNSPFAHWVAPSDGYLERVVLMVGEANTATDDFGITVYKNGSQLSSTVVQTQGAVRTVTEFAFGGSYSYSKRDRIVLYMSKAGNTSDLYTFNAYFYVQQ